MRVPLPLLLAVLAATVRRATVRSCLLFEAPRGAASHQDSSEHGHSPTGATMGISCDWCSSRGGSSRRLLVPLGASGSRSHHRGTDGRSGDNAISVIRPAHSATSPNPITQARSAHPANAQAPHRVQITNHKRAGEKTTRCTYSTYVTVAASANMLAQHKRTGSAGGHPGSATVPGDAHPPDEMVCQPQHGVLQ